MYSINPGLLAALTEDRAAELRRCAGSARDRQEPARRPAGDGAELRRSALRRAAGWALVSLGLRLVLPRRSVLPASSTPAQRAALRAAR
jgi:hypothetical protein